MALFSTPAPAPPEVVSASHGGGAGVSIVNTGPKVCAYVFVLYGGGDRRYSGVREYFMGVIAAAFSLIKHGSIHHRVLLHTPDVDIKELRVLAEATGLFDVIVECDYIVASPQFFSNPQAHSRFGNIFTKYRVLGLTHYEKVLLLDADLHIRGNIDRLFELQPPAAMVRGPHKPPFGHPVPQRAPINAGVMLLKPSADTLREVLAQITGQQPPRLSQYNSPDADYLTEHYYIGQFSSISLEYNFQLEFTELDPLKGTVRFSPERATHFSDEGATLPWSSLKVLHFSGAKPWPHMLEDTSALQRLSIANQSAEVAAKALGKKLLAGIAEYAQLITELQGICSQLQLGEGTLWSQTMCTHKEVGMDLNVARARVHRALPPGGRWFEGERPGSAVWVPPGSGLPLSSAPFGRCAPVAVYLELAEESGGPLAVDEQVLLSHGVASASYRVVEFRDDGQTAVLSRPVVLPEEWQAIESGAGMVYYHNRSTEKTQWEHPCLPQGWSAGRVPDYYFSEEANPIYYYNEFTEESRWQPPTEEILHCPVSALTSKRRTMATLWRRSFLSDKDNLMLQTMQQALRAVDVSV